MANKTRTRLYIALITAAIVVALAFVNAAVSTSTYTLEENISNGVGQCHHLEGDYTVVIYDTFDGATATLQKALGVRKGNTDKCASADKMKNVAAAALVGAVAETEYVGMQNSWGYYRLLVAGGGGSESLKLELVRMKH